MARPKKESLPSRRLTEEDRRWIEEHWDAVLAVARRRVLAWKCERILSAEDVASDALIMLARKRSEVTLSASFVSQVVTCRIVDQLRLLDGRNTSKSFETRQAIRKAMTLRPRSCWLDEDIVSDDCPPGALLESQDEIERMSRCLPPKYAAAVRLLYLDAGCADSQAAAGRKLGVSESRVSQIIAKSYATLREAFPDRALTG